MVLVDSRHGGHVLSQTNAFGTFGGTLASTVKGRERGETIADGGGIVLPGVNPDGTPNTTEISIQDYYQNRAFTGPFEIYDGSAVVLREVRLGYSLRPGLVARLHLSTLEIAAIGRNLLAHAAAPNIDPQTVLDTGANQGDELIGALGTRSYGLVLKIVP